MAAMAAPQSAIESALAQAALPSEATQAAAAAAAAAAQALQAGQTAEAMAAMQQAMAAMQQAAAQAMAMAQGMPMPGMPGMPGPDVPMPPSDMPATDSKAHQSTPLAPLSAAGPKDTRKKDGNWAVSLEPTEREVLSTSASEQYPDRYHQALSDYYRALAAGGAQP
jgi:hypothetical protein